MAPNLFRQHGWSDCILSGEACPTPYHSRQESRKKPDEGPGYTGTMGETQGLEAVFVRMTKPSPLFQLFYDTGRQARFHAGVKTTEV